MTWIKRFKKSLNIHNNLIALLIPGLLILSAIILLAIFFNLFFNQQKSQKLTPVEYIEVKESFSGQLYFNNTMGTSIFSDVIIPAIDNSQKTIELAVYSMDNIGIKNALYRAAERGVKIELVFSDKREAGHDQIFKDLPANIKRQDLSSSSGSMHHKFLLIDRGNPEAKLFFGSYNFTLTQEKYDPCFLLETTRPEIINIFGKEFDLLTSEHHSLGKFKLSPNPFAALIRYPEGFLEIWFGPQSSGNGLKERMIGLIKNASDNIKVMIWYFNSDDIADELAISAREKSVKIITDDSNYDTPESVFSFLLAEKIKRHLNNLEIITDAKRNQEVENDFKEKDLNSFLHHHLLLVDDRVAVFGTNNWSNGGFYKNDESVMISNIDSLVKPFIDVWKFNYEKNK